MPQLNDTTAFKVTIIDEETRQVVSVADATTKEIKFKKPTGEVITKTAVFDTDGTDGVIKYTTVVGDLDKLGEWEIQGFVVTPTNSNNSEVGNFQVYYNL